MARSDYAEMILGWIGSPNFSLLDKGSGWPSIIEWKRDGNILPLALHISPAGDYYRKPYEWRFQNPAGGKHPVDDAGGFPILMGFDEAGDEPILILANGQSRVGRTTRFSVLFNRNILAEARQHGIAKYVSTAPETMYAFKPKLLAMVLELVFEQEDISARDLREAAAVSGFTSENTAEAAERARRAAKILVRDQRFGRNVRKAYGDMCGMCGLGLGMVSGAHIYPVSAPNSPDVIPNGVSLCGNHHSAYDNYDIWFEPVSFAIKFSPRFTEAAKTSEPLAKFIDYSFSTLRVPNYAAHRPLTKWIDKRKEFYEEEYGWV